MTSTLSVVAHEDLTVVHVKLDMLEMAKVVLVSFIFPTQRSEILENKSLIILAKTFLENACNILYRLVNIGL